MVGSYGVGRQRGVSGPVWLLGGILIGVLATLGGEKLLRHLGKGTEIKGTRPAPVVRLASSGAVVQLTPDQLRRGVLVSSTQPLKLVKGSDSKLAKQDGAKIFTGFKSWTGTVNYIKTGQGEFIIKTPTGEKVETGWRPQDYQDFVGGATLQMHARPGETFVLYFQRKQRGPINLGTISVGTGAGSAANGNKTSAPKPAGNAT